MCGSIDNTPVSVLVVKWGCVKLRPHALIRESMMWIYCYDIRTVAVVIIIVPSAWERITCQTHCCGRIVWPPRSIGWAPTMSNGSIYVLTSEDEGFPLHSLAIAPHLFTVTSPSLGRAGNSKLTIKVMDGNEVGWKRNCNSSGEEKTRINHFFFLLVVLLFQSVWHGVLVLWLCFRYHLFISRQW